MCCSLHKIFIWFGGQRPWAKWVVQARSLGTTALENREILQCWYLDWIYSGKIQNKFRWGHNCIDKFLYSVDSYSYRLQSSYYVIYATGHSCKIHLSIFRPQYKIHGKLTNKFRNKRCHSTLTGSLSYGSQLPAFCPVFDETSRLEVSWSLGHLRIVTLSVNLCIKS